MMKLDFVKMVASGNDFVVVDCRRSPAPYLSEANGTGSLACPERSRGIARRSLARLANILCQRRTGVGADGLLVLERSKKADFRMRIFNKDGSEAEMCGNGLRCAALRARGRQKLINIETKAGIYRANVTGKNKVKVRMEDPKDLRLDIPIRINGRPIKVNYIDTGVPHAVIFVEGLEKIDIGSIGQNIRHHKRFQPRGTNVDLVEIIDNKNIKMRTYERGVEGETLTCGTGAVAAAIITKYKIRLSAEASAKAEDTKYEINIHTEGGILKVYFDKRGNKIKDVYLEGEVKKVYAGKIEM